MAFKNDLRWDAVLMGSVVGTVNAKIRKKKKNKKKACRTTSRLINQTYKTHYESPKIKIFLILFFFIPDIIFIFVDQTNKVFKLLKKQHEN